MNTVFCDFQNICEEMEYSQLLDEAIEIDDKNQRMVGHECVSS